MQQIETGACRASSQVELAANTARLKLPASTPSSKVTASTASTASLKAKNLKPNFRELLLKYGAKYLSDEHLLAILLQTGTLKKNVLSLACEVMDALDSSEPCSVQSNLSKIQGIGTGKLCTILAALELGRRFFSVNEPKISTPNELVPLLMHYATRKQETFLCISLSGANEVIAVRVVSVGTVNRTLVHPREVFADPITDRAASVIVAHNHPSGNIKPSTEDISLTKRLVEVGELLGISLLDHLIVNSKGEYFSFMEEGFLS